MVNKTKDILMKVRRQLVTIKRRYKRTTDCSTYYIDNNYRTWDCPIDGLDYAIQLIDKRLKK